MIALTGVQGGHLQCASRPHQHCNRASALTRNTYSSRRILESRAQVASTQTVTTEEQAQPKARGWAPWRVLSPFGKKQKQQVEQLATISAEELRQLLAAEQEGKAAHTVCQVVPSRPSPCTTESLPSRSRSSPPFSSTSDVQQGLSTTVSTDLHYSLCDVV